MRQPRNAVHFLALAIAASFPCAAFANVYPTNLGQTSDAFSSGQSVTLSYLLNEDATNVTVSVLNSSNSVVRTFAPGAQAKGVQSVMWDGKDNSSNFLPTGDYSFRVTTMGQTRTDWTQISTDSELNNFEVPSGVAVNKNSDSPYYGRVYVSNARNLPTAAGRAMTDGLFVLNSDLSATGITGGTGPYSGGVPWSQILVGTAQLPEVASPFRVEVGPDDSVYIADWSDGHSGLWQAPPDLGGTWTEVLDSTGRDADGLNETHGSISDLVITGTGANRVIYTADEDYVPAGSILRYDIGTTPTFTGGPSGILFDNQLSGNWNINFFNSMAVDNDGNFWYSQNRSNGTDRASLIQIDPTTGSIIWDSLAQLGSPDPLRGTQGIAYDPVNDVIALVTNINTTGGNIVIFDPTSKAILTQFAFGNTTNTDVTFDNAGNLYVGNRTGERVRIWSPPSGTGDFVANDFTTNSLAPLGAISFSAVANQDADFDNDGDVDGSDFLVWQRGVGSPGDNTDGDADGDGQVTAADLGIWKTNFGQSGGVTAIPEPATLGLAALAVLAVAGLRRRS